MVNPNRFYTYAYLRVDRTPYYIGKGKGNRIYYKYKNEIKPPKDKSRIIFLKQNLTEEEAFKHEKYMIAVFGRKDLGTGILRNKTDGGDGPAGAIRSEEFKNNVSKTHKGEKNYCYGKKGETHPCYRRIYSYEDILKISGQNNHSYGKKWWNDGCGNNKRSVECPGEGWVLGVSEETKRKNSEANKGEKNYLSKLWKITKNTGEEILVYGLNGWAKENNYHNSSLYNVYTGKYKKHKDVIKVEVVK